jgi:hypothetical protein
MDRGASWCRGSIGCAPCSHAVVGTVARSAYRRSQQVLFELKNTLTKKASACRADAQLCGLAVDNRQYRMEQCVGKFVTAPV